MKWKHLEKKNDELNKILHGIEMTMWNDIRHNNYSWLVLDDKKKKKLFRLIDIYSEYSDIVDYVKNLNKKVEKVKTLRDAAVDSE